MRNSMKCYGILAVCCTPIFATNQAVAIDNSLQIGLSVLSSAGASTVNNESVETLQAGGHDPKRTGFGVQNVEMSFSAVVDPYLNAQANLITQITPEGETLYELEEAFFITSALPYGLQIKGGQFYTEFGRQNKLHPHSWAFADLPVISSRLLGGDGLRSQGARLSWLSPLPWYSEFIGGVQNANGETTYSFVGTGSGGHAHGGDTGVDPMFAEHALVERPVNGLDDFLYSARWLNGFDISDTLSLNLGVSALTGPNNTGLETSTAIYGADMYLKWQPERTSRGFPFVAWHTEFMTRSYEAGDHDSAEHDTLKDSGFFSSLIWGFKPGWVAGTRFEMANGTSDAHDHTGGVHEDDPMRDLRTRVSANLSWYPTEYSKIRLQYNLDQAEHLPENAHSVWLQVEYNIGSHMAHTF